MTSGPNPHPRLRPPHLDDADTRKRPHGGNASATGAAMPLGMVPPDEIANDLVDEASWESFPASDPPNWRLRR